MTALFSPADLGVYLHREVDPIAAATARRIAAGWLSSATGIIRWPDPTPDDLWGWALELAAIAYEYPAGGTREDIGDVTHMGWGDRRAEILADAARAYAAQPVRSVSTLPARLRW